MVAVGAGEAPAPCLMREGRSYPPSPSDVVWNSSVESHIMARSGDGGPLWVAPMTVASEPSLPRERHRPPKKSAMNSRLPKQMVSPRENPPHVKRSPSTVTVIPDEGTIRTYREKPLCKSPFLAYQLSVFSTLARTWWSRSRVPNLRWSCEIQSTR
jgi:hypothetical protein